MAPIPTNSPQVILANERTFLAWIRTSLALLATGAALIAFDVPIAEGWRDVAASAFVLLGLAAALQAWLGWRATDAAIREGRTLPAPALRTVLAVGVIAAVIIVGVGLLVR